jgi:hypothetical protein
VPFCLVQHPDQRDIAEWAGVFKPVQLPTDIAMGSAEPDLFDMTLKIRRASP